jgi:hypothetical protein
MINICPAGHLLMMPSALLLLLPLIATSFPIISSKVSADSISIFTDPSLRYPKLPDAMNSLCRRLSDQRRSYEMDRHYRTLELRGIVRGNLDAVCGEIWSSDKQKPC